jgi:hypothetical protein
MGPRAGLDAMVKRKIPSPCRYSYHPARSPALYHFAIPVHHYISVNAKNNYSKSVHFILKVVSVTLCYVEENNEKQHRHIVLRERIRRK